jgi:cytochrome c
VAFGPISGNADKGKQLYYDHGCYGCHGYEGIGRRNLANNVSGIMFNEEVYLTYLRGRADMNPLFPTQSMPNYATASLPDDEAIDIYAYIRTFEDTSPEVEDIPVLIGILEAAEKAAADE